MPQPYNLFTIYCHGETGWGTIDCAVRFPHIENTKRGRKLYDGFPNPSHLAQGCYGEANVAGSDGLGSPSYMGKNKGRVATPALVLLLHIK